MHNVVYVRVRPFGKVYKYSNKSYELKEGSFVVVESDFGITIGYVIKVSNDTDNGSLKSVIRIATDEDFETFQKNLSLEKEAWDFCLERIKARELPMKLIVVECALDRKRIIFYFTAEGRIDFRELVRDLAGRFKTRIEMRQIGVRDGAKFLGGIGVCGVELCCKRFISNFKPISLRMAKEQEIVMNVSKLSGICGRLMCCLRYEIEEEEEVLQDEEIVYEEEKEPEYERISYILNRVKDDTEEDTSGSKKDESK
jgi:cell fate regulator YaaT (PSP1 superfamily)